MKFIARFGASKAGDLTRLYKSMYQGRMTSSAPRPVRERPANSNVQSVLVRRRPDDDPLVIGPLAEIWDEVIHRIIVETLGRDDKDAALHLNIKAEMIEEIARLSLWLADQVLDRRLGDRVLTEIDVAEEREACLGESGSLSITRTAELVHDRIWQRFMRERWLPKSAKAVERDENPRQTKLVVKRVVKNHFIPKSFIRDHWATDRRVQRWRRDEDGWHCREKGFGEWGHRKNLYSDRTEAYFGLLEGDATEPMRRLLDTRPLNDPQREAFVGFLVIQMLRNPYLVDAVGRETERVAVEIGHDDPNIAKAAYDTLFSSNEFYHRLSHPLMWSRWAIVRAQTPAFVLPDTFLARQDLGDGVRVIAPITPQVCFVTLPEREAEKRVVPFHIAADGETAALIGDLLVRSAASEFLAAPGFVPPPEASASFANLLARLSTLVDQSD